MFNEQAIKAGFFSCLFLIKKPCQMFNLKHSCIINNVNQVHPTAWRTDLNSRHELFGFKCLIYFNKIINLLSSQSFKFVPLKKRGIVKKETIE